MAPGAWAYDLNNGFTGHASFLSHMRFGQCWVLTLPLPEFDEIVQSWWDESAPITEAIMFFDEVLDKVARRITLCSVSKIQKCWRF
jgi:hypothetical protein